MNEPFFPVVTLRGEGFDRGLALGRALAPQIRANAALYVELIGRRTRRDTPTLMKAARRFVPSIKRYAPDQLDVLEGMAQAVELPMEHLLIINVRTELMADQHAECTTIGVRAGRSATGTPLAAQNWDWLTEIRDRCAVYRVEPVQGPRMLHFCEAGQVAKLGMNEYGLSVLLNILMISEPADERHINGLPVHFFLRRLLEARNVAEATALALEIPVAGASHILVAGPQQIRGFECSSRGAPEILEPTDGLLCHTNHCVSYSLAPLDKGPRKIPDSLDRLHRLHSLAGTDTLLSLADLQSILCDHEGLPNAICRHAEKDAAYRHPWETVASLLMDPAARTIAICKGHPCSNSYQTFSF